MPSWVEYAIWWQVYPLGFLNAELEHLPDDAELQHRLQGLDAWLDYLVELGANGLLLGPIFESQTHGYDTVDYFSIDRRLGDEADFQDLVRKAHERGIKVMLDGVFNHVGDRFPAFQKALQNGPGAPEEQWFTVYWRDGQEPDYEHFEGHKQLVSLNHDSQAVVDHVVDVMCYWLERGADAWRLDAAYAVPASFWSRVVPRVRERFPEAYFLGEMIHGDYPEYVEESTLDSVTQYELWKAIWSSMNDRNFHELAWSLQRHDEFLDSFVPLTFIGNHDVTRIATQLNVEAHLAHAVVILMTTGGTPSIYAGDEQAFRGLKEEREGGDEEIRPAFPEDPDELATFGWGIFSLHRELIALRRREPWLHWARSRVELVTNDQLMYLSHYDGNAILVALNLADEPATLPARPISGVIAGAADLGVDEITLGPHGWAVLSV